MNHMWNLILKNYTNEPIYKTETELEISKTNLWLPKGKCDGGDKSGAWDEHSTIYKTDNQQGPTVELRELYSIFCDNVYEKRI